MADRFFVEINNLDKTTNPLPGTGVERGGVGRCDLPTPFSVGSSYFIRTVTYHIVGTVTGVVGAFLTLKDAAWVADSGRLSTALETGELNEVEPVGGAIVGLGSIADAFVWAHKLPLTKK